MFELLARSSFTNAVSEPTMEDLDIAKLADYLHLTPPQVSKMALRGRIPARKVGGEWRFNEAEIHHWLEEQIGFLKLHRYFSDFSTRKRVAKKKKILQELEDRYSAGF